MSTITVLVPAFAAAGGAMPGVEASNPGIIEKS